jgi:hypothetical protein
MIPIRVVWNFAEDFDNVAIFGLSHRGGFHGRPNDTACNLADGAIEAVTQRALLGSYQLAVLGRQPFYAHRLKKILLGCSNKVRE